MNGRIAALAGRVPELTAEQLDRMDAVALAALYSSGVRLLTVKNNDTITLHAVDPMGRLVWLDSNMPKNNCFDNTNFISPINQRGQSSYSTTWGMAIDRWYLGSAGSVQNATMLLTGNGITLGGASGGCPYIQTRIETLDETTNYTAFITKSDGSILPTTVTKEYIVLQKQTHGFIPFSFQLDSGSTLVSAELYKGDYTVKTKPTRRTLDPSIEWVKCLRCFRVIPLQVFVGVVLSNATAMVNIEFSSAPMQKTPSIQILQAELYVGGAWVASSDTKVVYSSSRNITLELTAPGGGLSGCVMTRINAWLLAEL